MPSPRLRKAARPPRAAPATPGRGLTLSRELRAPPRCAALPSPLRAVRKRLNPQSPAGSGTSRAPGGAGQGEELFTCARDPARRSVPAAAAESGTSRCPPDAAVSPGRLRAACGGGGGLGAARRGAVCGGEGAPGTFWMLGAAIWMRSSYFEMLRV